MHKRKLKISVSSAKCSIYCVKVVNVKLKTQKKKNPEKNRKKKHSGLQK